jgi:hypothetical protein
LVTADEEQIGWLSAQVKDLHHRHGLALDEEVSYEVKLYATSAEVSKAIGFGGYHVDATGALTVPPVVVEPASELGRVQTGRCCTGCSTPDSRIWPRTMSCVR